MSERCKNCSAPLTGDFCSQCGQSTAEFDLPVAEFAKELAAETLSLDSRLRVTLKNLFFVPGAVPLEYVRGHRARFVPPIRLYLFASFAMFLVLAFGSGLTVQDVRVHGRSLPDSTAVSAPTAESAPTPSGERSLSQRFSDRIADGLARVTADSQGFTQDFFNRMTRAFFVLLPVFALILKAFYRRRLYVHHLVFALYLHSLAFIVVAVVGVPDALGLTQLGKVASVLLLWVPVYTYFAMRRFYGEGRLRTGFKLAGVTVLYGALSIVAWLGILVLTLMAV